LDRNGQETGFYEVQCEQLKRFARKFRGKQLVNDTNVGIPGKQVHLMTNNHNACTNPEGNHIFLC